MILRLTALTAILALGLPAGLAAQETPVGPDDAAVQAQTRERARTQNPEPGTRQGSDTAARTEQRTRTRVHEPGTGAGDPQRSQAGAGHGQRSGQSAAGRSGSGQSGTRGGIRSGASGRSGRSGP